MSFHNKHLDLCNKRINKKNQKFFKTISSFFIEKDDDYDCKNLAESKIRNVITSDGSRTHWPSTFFDITFVNKTGYYCRVELWYIDEGRKIMKEHKDLTNFSTLFPDSKPSIIFKEDKISYPNFWFEVKYTDPKITFTEGTNYVNIDWFSKKFVVFPEGKPTRNQPPRVNQFIDNNTVRIKRIIEIISNSIETTRSDPLFVDPSDVTKEDLSCTLQPGD